MFGDRLKSLRESHGLTQLARRMDSKSSTISLWESGKRTPSIEMAIKVADYFRVSLDYLVGRSEKGKVQEPGIRKTVKVIEELTPEQREKVSIVCGYQGLSGLHLQTDELKSRYTAPTSRGRG